MRIALFTLDSLASHRPIRDFIDRHAAVIVFVGLSARPPRRGFWPSVLRDFRRAGWHYLAFMACNFVLPRWRAAWRGAPTLQEACAARGIPAKAVRDVNAPDLVDLLRALNVDLIVSCYFEQVFGAQMLALPRFGAVNVHTSLLPDHRGPMPVLYGMMDDPPSLGVSVHRMDGSIDTGPLLAQEAVAPQGTSVLRMMTTLHDRGLALLGTLLPAIEQGRIDSQQQSGGRYEGFPTRRVIHALRQRRGRLVDWRDVRDALSIRIGT